MKPQVRRLLEVKLRIEELEDERHDLISEYYTLFCGTADEQKRFKGDIEEEFSIDLYRDEKRKRKGVG
jgi:hypothetical protein